VPFEVPTKWEKNILGGHVPTDQDGKAAVERRYYLSEFLYVILRKEKV